MKYLKYILIWTLLTTYIIISLGFVLKSREKVICNKINISISDEETNKFLNKDDISKILNKYKIEIIGKPVDSVNTYLTETILDQSPLVQETKAYTTIDGRLNISVEQRKPILHIINKKFQNYYIDKTGKIILLLKQYASYTLVANGNINEPFDVTTEKNIFPSKPDSILKPNIIYDLYHIALYIENDEFWRSQIVQIYVNKHGEMELIPRIGSHVIIFGKADDTDMKFKKLKAMYRVFNDIGWNLYKTINLKFKDQVVCTKI